MAYYKKLAAGNHRQWAADLGSVRLGGSEQISELIQRIADMVERLCWSGCPGYTNGDRDRLVVSAAFNALPQEYASVVAIAEEFYTSTGRWSVPDAESRLTRFQNTLTSVRGSSSSGEPSIHFVRGVGGGRGGRGGRGVRNKENIQCHRCQGWGHYKYECPEQAAEGGGGTGGAAANLLAKPQQSPEAKATPSPGGDQAPFNSPRAQLSASGPRTGGVTPRRLDLDFLEPEGNAISAPSPPGGKAPPQLPHCSPVPLPLLEHGAAASPLPVDPCDTLRQAVMQYIPDLGAPRIWEEEQVLGCVEVSQAGGDPAVRTVYQMEVDLQDGAGRAMPLACKGVKVVLSEAEDAALAAGGAGEADVPVGFLPALQEAVSWVAVARRFRLVHGEEALGRCFPVVFGWDVLQPAPRTYEFVMYMEWMDNGTVFDYLKNIMTAPALPEGDMYEMVLDAMRQMVNLVDSANKAGLCFGDLKAQNMLVDAEEPYMATDIYSPPEFWVGWAREALVSGEAAGRAYEWDMMQLREEAVEQPCWPGAVMLLDSLKSECATRDAALEWLQLQGMNGGRSYMCGASHTYLVGATISHLLRAVETELSARPGAAYVQQLAFVSELKDVMVGLMTEEPASRPSLQQLRRRLAEMRGDWCYWG
eukprot:XP_001693268.1 predicted protein [Chlamydomonas reinhardtii]